MKVALGQINATVGDLAGNTRLILQELTRARDAGCSLVAFPELAVSGYPPNDLLLNRAFMNGISARVQEIADAARDIAVFVGAVQVLAEGQPRPRVYDASRRAQHPELRLANAALLLAEGGVQAVQAKTFLPNYDVFDETRYFEPAASRRLFEVQGHRFGVNLCEDIWVDDGPLEEQVRMGAEFVITISASPCYLGKGRARKELVRRRAQTSRCPVLYVNLVGGQDALIFDGGSLGYDSRGQLIALGRQFASELVMVDLDDPVVLADRDLSEVEEAYHALVLGLRDYVNKNGFGKVVLGLSGGVDSALVLALAQAALGPDRVVAVTMPGPYTSRSSLEDARRLCANFYVELKTIPIDHIFRSYLGTLKAELRGGESDIAEQNLQARIRGNILMALSNRHGWLVLSTGNKSEVAVGYNTLYGDMAGGLSVISDLPKTMVYRVCEYINRQVGRELIPARVLTRAPSAELRSNQTDQDDLPPYDVLDPILELYIEQNRSEDEIVAAGHPRAIVHDVLRRVDRNEYKRQQAPLGLKITPKAFGFGRRMPITNKFTA